MVILIHVLVRSVYVFCPGGFGVIWDYGIAGKICYERRESKAQYVCGEK